MGRVSSRHKVVRIDLDSGVTRAIDTVAGEEPLEIRVGGETFTVTMRTPGHDVDLAHGLLRAEGLIAARDDVRSARFCSDLDSLNVLDVQVTGARSGEAVTSTRHLASLGGCGLCGTTAVEAVEAVTGARPPEVQWEAEQVASALDELRGRQQLFGATGGVHGAGLVPVGADRLTLVREDIGRHNAVDKVLGGALVLDIDTSGALLVVSSRASFEIVQKAAVSEVAVLACVSAPSSLAIEAADRLGVTLVGFARGRRMSVYTHAHRIPH
ncbi:formate dehydrogenase accessory sulfurtransferase FdhD [Knoellia sp. CPCC 206435]|uniref:formate dehydrogenase accessory sulfurtransferase FdhD n=1 Tax=Knoellia terrae TaxID=3404797 RepID=UPI003B42B1A8